MKICRKCQCDTFGLSVKMSISETPSNERRHISNVFPHFQMEMARMMSEKRTFAALASCSVPITMRIAQDSNCA